jgi:hypothetical protein
VRAHTSTVLAQSPHGRDRESCARGTTRKNPQSTTSKNPLTRCGGEGIVRPKSYPTQ